MILTRQNAKFVIPFLGVIAVLLIVLLGPSTPDRVATSGQGGEGVEAEAQVWTCSMHPQVRQPRPGDCPICGMDLIPVEAEPGAAIEFFDFTTGDVSPVAALEHPDGYWPSVSPDEKWILYVRDEEETDIMMVENFR